MKQLFACLLALVAAAASAQSRWHIMPDRPVIVSDVASTVLPHSDHIEMSGKKMAMVLYWNIDTTGTFGLNRSLVFPMLRTIPNDTHASFTIHNDLDLAGMLRVNNKRVDFHTHSMAIDGDMEVTADYSKGANALELKRIIFPSMERPAMAEIYTARNTGEKPLDLLVPALSQKYESNAAKGVGGAYVVQTDVQGAGCYTLAPGDSAVFALTVRAFPETEGVTDEIDPAAELAARRAFIDAVDSNLILETPDKAIDTEFRYAKIRGAESIYKTKGGYMHGPGGEAYYAALWCNDQAEYINPLFPFLGYDIGNESALNCFRHYARFINDDYKPIPSSIIAEGDGIWNGAGDRGDAAMLAYGASRYALARGNADEARELWHLIEWCLEYCRRKLNADGVVLSDHDELEGRFPAGDANLCTASLYYDALVSAAYLGKELDMPASQLSAYKKQAEELRESIEKYFGRNVQGYDTYRYYDGNDVLRSWICIPLVMGINERADATVAALFSPEMYTADGVLTCQGYPIFWDRATLYTLRGALYAGFPDEVVPRLSDFSRRRLLGDHVPYPVEAWPEGSQRHLSAESGLYCRIITEGLFGIRPTGLRSFDMKPQLPSYWDNAALRHIRAFGADFDIEVERLSNGKLRLTITEYSENRTRHRCIVRRTLTPGESTKVKL